MTSKRIFTLMVLLSALCLITNAQKSASRMKIENSDLLKAIVETASQEAISKYSAKGLAAENFAVTLIDVRDPQNPKSGDFRGNERIYPASVVKLFFLAAAHDWMERGKLKDTPELRRALKDMIVDSSNDATHQIVDVLTDATGGGELPPDKLKKWIHKRSAVNRYFAALGYENINVTNKTYCEDLYGRERQMWDGGKVRNMLTTNATARLMGEITLGKSVNAVRSKQMMELLKRDWESKAIDPEDQAHGFTAIALPSGAKLWSKAGWTSNSRHDVAYVEMPDGRKFVVCIYTEKFAKEREILPDIVRSILLNLK